MKKQIWVPGEKPDFEIDGLVVEDAKSARQHLIDSKVQEMVHETRMGRRVRTRAVRMEVVRFDGEYAVVKVPGEKPISVRLLGDWHRAGCLRIEEFETATIANAS